MNTESEEIISLKSQLADMKERAGKLEELVKLAAQYLTNHEAWGWDTEILEKARRHHSIARGEPLIYACSGCLRV